MNPALQVLKDRGFFQQCTDVDGLSALMDQGPVAVYVGADPTGPSLHIGHMVPFFALRHLKAHGHQVIALLGGGTARIGDPSGKTEMRQMLTYEQIAANAKAMTGQLDHFIGFDGGKGMAVNNADWLGNLNYIDFLRDIGVHFSVNRMLSFEAYKRRMETGLTFIEFNYQLLQSYDFLQLFDRHQCRLQIGGDDQWGNIVAGIDLIRRVRGAETFGLTFPLITTADGKKMGKSEKGALFLNPDMVSPYEFFQYWRNVQDADVERFLLMFTFLPVDECKALARSEGAGINQAKERLAWEVTMLIHGREAADQALAGARAAFSGEGDQASMPTFAVSFSDSDSPRSLVDLLVESGIAASKSEARRLVQQGGITLEGEKVSDLDLRLAPGAWEGKEALLLRSGKKRWLRLVLA